jgi:cytochrome c oxidase cbb3-type subunit 3
MRRWLPSALTLALAAALIACEREERRFRQPPAASAALQNLRMSDLQPGSPPPSPGAGRAYDESAYAISEGQRLYNWYNCVGCHFHGGGGIGPPLMDDQWIYGSGPENIFATIIQGRPNGMPAFGGKIPEFQVWQIAAYVRSLSGLTPKDAVPARSDHMSAEHPPASIEPQAPEKTGRPR